MPSNGKPHAKVPGGPGGEVTRRKAAGRRVQKANDFFSEFYPSDEATP